MTESLTIDSPDGPIQALSAIPADAKWVYVFAHGAGAGMRHTFMTAAADALAERGVAILRYEYPYMSAGSRRPDAAPVLERQTRAVAAFAAESYPALRIAAGGKSMGGRMTLRAQAASPLPRVEALVFFGFPLHPPGKPGTERAEHLTRVTIPLLFLQGTRDALAHLELMRSVVEPLADRATLHVVDAADHSFAVLKRSGRTNEQVLAEIADAAANWLQSL